VLEKLLNMIEVIVFATRAFVFSAFFMKKCNFGFKTANSPAAYVVALYSGSTFPNEPDNGFQRHDASEKCHERFECMAAGSRKPERTRRT